MSSAQSFLYNEVLVGTNSLFRVCWDHVIIITFTFSHPLPL